MKNYILYHGNCPDGFGAAFAAWLHFRNDATYIPCFYGKPIPQIEDNSNVYIVDFSFSRSILIDLAQRCNNIVVLDHHQTAQKDLEGLEFCIFDMDKSGAVLTYEYFYPELQLPEFFLYLQDRDLWKFELPMSREVSMALRSYPYDFNKWSEISGLVTCGQIYELSGICIDNLKKEGVTCRRLTEQQVENMAKYHRWTYIDPRKREIKFTEKLEPGGMGDPVVPEYIEIMPVANASAFFSEVGEKLLQMYPSFDCAAYYSDRQDGKQQWGLRSRSNFDCSILAKAFGGGGHKQASGFVY